MPTHPPTLLREIQDRIGGVLVRPSAPLIWAGAIVAVMMAIPLVGAIDALVAQSRAPTDLSLEASIAELTGQLADTINHLVIGMVLLVFVVVPLSYGAALMGVRAIRGEASSARDLFAGYLRPLSFSIFSLVLIVSAAIPLIVWLIVAIIVAVIVGVLAALGGDDSTAQVTMITTTIIIVGLPFIFLALYLQVRLFYGGIAIIDPRAAGAGAMTALSHSWRMTRRQNSALSSVASYATWVLIRSTVGGYGIGLFTRGLPEFVALFSGSYEVLSERARPQEQC
ncbi:MAG: hypothetical protein EXS17_07185 [Phycisphaerales bacterium]|nr:hypothetical protein [Phycisphaerales bacterium]